MRKLYTTPISLSLALSLGGLASISSCTRPRPMEYVDEMMNQEVLELNSIHGEAIMQASPSGNKKIWKMIKGPSSLRHILESITLPEGLSDSVRIHFELSPNALFLLAEIESPKQLAPPSRALVETKNSKTLLRMYAIPVKRLGRIKVIKNEFKEKTNRMDLEATDLTAATHLQLDLRPQNIRRIGDRPEEKELLREIYSISEIKGRTFKAGEWEKLTQTDLDLPQAQDIFVDVVPAAQSASAHQMEILIYVKRSLSDIQDQSLLQKLKHDSTQKEILSCGDQCVYVLEKILLANTVEVQSQKDDKGYATGNIQVENKSGTSWLRLVKHQKAAQVSQDRLYTFHPQKMIFLQDIKDQLFYYRRTLEDVSSTVQLFGPGFSSDLEVVRFIIERDRIVIKRAYNLGYKKSQNSLDQEELLSLPAKYYTLYNTKGERLSDPIPSRFEQADLAVIDWTRNQIEASGSPLSRFGIGACFASSGYQQVTDINQQLKSEGTLHFSILTSQTFITECMSYFRVSDYWNALRVQSNFILKERVSFQKITADELQKPALQEIPFQAQNALNFGYFTISQMQSDHLPNRIGSQKAYPMLHDFKDKKTITYYLGGLDQTPEPIRSAIIEVSKQVIKDWNDILEKAFAGSSLEQPKGHQYLRLELLPENSSVKLGDLNASVIWNFPEPIDSGVLGMAQPAANPFNGRVHAANVLMYSGNVWQYLQYMKEQAKILKQYENLKAQALKKALAEAENSTQSIRLEPLGGGTTLSNVGHQEFKKKLTGFSSQSSMKVALATKGLREQKEWQSFYQRDLKSTRAIGNNLPNNSLWLYELTRKAISQRYVQDPRWLQSWIHQELLQKDLLPGLNPNQKQWIALEARRLHFQNTISHQLQRVGGCAQYPSPIPSFEADDLLKNKDIDIFKNWFAKTLSHELGHALGLTHNFKGSYDKANFQFFDGENKLRHYSSIMDYPDGMAQNYQKPGPYDLYAIRAGYTGRLETQEGKLISLEQIKQALKLNSLWDLKAIMTQKLPIKKFHYCTDIHAGWEPSCNRWDQGTTPEELMRFYKKQYENNYALLNAKHNRIQSVSLGSYIGNIMYSLYNMRQFMDETFYRAITGDPEAGQWAQAAFEGYQTLLNILNTPSVQARFFDLNRFIPHSYQNAKGEKQMTLIEAKPLQNIYLSDSLDDIDLIGYEYDKALATQFLSVSDFGHPRYDQMGLRVNYAHFEKFLMQLSPALSPFLQLLPAKMKNLPLAFWFTADGQITQIPLITEDTSLTKSYFLLTSQLFLQSNTVSTDFNFASLFQLVPTHQALDEEVSFVATNKSFSRGRGIMKIWAPEHASLSKEVIEYTNELLQMAADAESMNQTKLENNSASCPGVCLKNMELNKFINLWISRQAAVYKRILGDEKVKAAYIKSIVQLTTQLNNLILSLSSQLKQQGLDLKSIKEEELMAALAPIAQQVKPQLTEQVQNEPLLYLAQSLAQGLAEEKGDEIEKLLARMLLVQPEEVRELTTTPMSNLFEAAKLSVLLNPELAN